MFMATLLQITLKNYKVHERHNSPQDPPPVSRPGQAVRTGHRGRKKTHIFKAVDSKRNYSSYYQVIVSHKCSYKLQWTD